MSLLSGLQTIAESCGVSVETGVFSGKAPDTYLVITPLSDSFELHADNAPGCETQEARLSLFTKGSYTKLKNALVRALLGADFYINDRRYIGFETETGYHHYAIDVAQIQNRHYGGALQGHQAECGKRERRKKRASRVTVSDAELFTRLLYYGLAHLHLSQDEVWLMPFGLLLDLWECHKQYNGQAVPAHEHYIDDIIPDGI